MKGNSWGTFGKYSLALLDQILCYFASMGLLKEMQNEPAVAGGTSGVSSLEGSSMLLDDYIRYHNLAALMDTLTVECAKVRPSDPMAWMADRLKLEATLRRQNRSQAPTLSATSEARRAMRHNPSLPR